MARESAHALDAQTRDGGIGNRCQMLAREHCFVVAAKDSQHRRAGEPRLGVRGMGGITGTGTKRTVELGESGVERMPALQYGRVEDENLRLHRRLLHPGGEDRLRISQKAQIPGGPRTGDIELRQRQGDVEAGRGDRPRSDARMSGSCRQFRQHLRIAGRNVRRGRNGMDLHESHDDRDRFGEHPTHACIALTVMGEPVSRDSLASASTCMRTGSSEIESVLLRFESAGAPDAA